MQHDDSKRRSRWILRVVEWNEPKARYPNIWLEGMPSQLLLKDRVARRLRLGDLIAVYHPQSQVHQERSEKFIGLSRVIGLGRARQPGQVWVDVETAHRLRKPVKADPGPHRVFLCCDPGWPEAEVALFRRVFDAAVAEGWKPDPDERAAPVPKEQAPAAPAPTAGEPPAVSATGTEEEPSAEEGRAPVVSEEPVDPTPAPSQEASGASGSETPAPRPSAKPPAAASRPRPGERIFAGAEYSGDMRDVKDRSWLAILGLEGERLRIIRLNPTGRSGLQSSLRDPDTSLMSAEAIGLNFPFALPEAFAESLLGGPFPEEGWWALVKRLERMTRPAFLAAVHEFRDARGEVQRLTDEGAGSLSPLHRGKRDVSPTAFHGVRMIGEDRSRYAIRPFESAQGRLLLEVNSRVSARNLLSAIAEAKGRAALIDRLGSVDSLPVDMDPAFVRTCRDRPSALDAVVAARCAAAAVVSGEADRTPEELAPGRGDQVRREGWIYGSGNPS